MLDLVLALYSEGPSDANFLPVIIQRTTQQLLITHGKGVIDVLEPYVLNHDIHALARQTERILRAAQKAAGYHILIVHADADSPKPDRAMQDRIQPGLDLLARSSEEVCRHVVPLIPVQMTEAWMLADAEAFRTVVGTDAQATELGLAMHPHEVESDPNPKQTFGQALSLALARRRRRRSINRSDMFRPLAERIDPTRLAAVPSYVAFRREMHQALIELNLAN